jgi:cell division protein FtsL
MNRLDIFREKRKTRRKVLLALIFFVFIIAIGIVLADYSIRNYIVIR